MTDPSPGQSGQAGQPGQPGPGVTTTVTVNGVPVELHHGEDRPGGLGALRDVAKLLMAAQRGGARPVVTVNGTVVGSGPVAGAAGGPQPSPLSYLDPTQQAAVRSALADLVATHPEQSGHLQQLLGLPVADHTQGGVPYGPGTPAYGSSSAPAWLGLADAGTLASSPHPTPETVARLADPPRPVPLAYRWATFALSFRELFLLAMAAVTPVALWILVPAARPVALLAATAAVVAFRVTQWRRTVPLLRWGRVATVTGARPVPSRTRYRNVLIRRATGWTASTGLSSGQAHNAVVDYELDGRPGHLSLRGVGYQGGVVLADSRDPGRARCVSQFPYDLTPNPDGQWPGRLTPWLWCGIIATLLVELTLVYVTVVVVVRTWL